MRRGRARSTANVVTAVIASAAVLYPAFFGAGPLPALGPTFNPATGAWTMAGDASIKNQTLRLAGLQQQVSVTLEADGTSHIVARSDHDLFLATGYMPARFGFGHQSALPVIMTCVVGLLFGLSGAWLGSAGRSLVRPRARSIS